jgi:kinesin family protein 11
LPKDTQEKLDEEKIVRKAHQNTEKQLRHIGAGLVTNMHASLDALCDMRYLTGGGLPSLPVIHLQVIFAIQFHAKLLEEMSGKIHQFVGHELDTVQFTRSHLKDLDILSLGLDLVK